MSTHGDSDQGAPFEATTGRIKELVPETHVRVYTRAAHGKARACIILENSDKSAVGLYVTYAEEVVKDILDFGGSLA